jgi:hypothetical protein
MQCFDLDARITRTLSSSTNANGMLRILASISGQHALF